MTRTEIERFRRLDAAFRAALEAGPDQRAAQLRAVRSEDPALFDELQALLLAHDAAGGPLDQPISIAGASSDLPPDEPTLSLPEDAVPGYRVVRVLGQGGMGTVFEAVQDHPRRTVALKMVRPELMSDQARRRFEYECQVLARLRHPGIAQVYEVGQFGSGGAADAVLRHGVCSQGDAD